MRDLRNRCSNLDNDLFTNYIRDNPLCDLCGMVEDVIHYFLHCRTFTLNGRFSMIQLRVFQPLSINLNHFGNDNWNIENNNVLFRDIHRYIHATKRFSNIFILCLKLILKHVLIWKYQFSMTKLNILFLNWRGPSSSLILRFSDHFIIFFI